MNSANIYLNFDGNCREAMTFYGTCLHSEPTFTPFSAVPQEMAGMAESVPDRILHAELTTGPVTLMACDTMPGMPFHQSGNFSISISCETQLEMETLFTSLGEGAKIIVPQHDAFWGGRFGMITDQFGINWMLSFRAS